MNIKDKIEEIEKEFEEKFPELLSSRETFEALPFSHSNGRLTGLELKSEKEQVKQFIKHHLTQLAKEVADEIILKERHCELREKE